MNDQRAAEHVLDVRVYYEDTDAGGIVYHANYLRFAERGRTEFLRARGLDHPTLLAAHGGLFVVTRCEIDFTGSARLDDVLCVETRVQRIGGARIVLAQAVVRISDVLAQIVVHLAFVRPDGRPIRLPPAFVGSPT